LGEKHKVSQGSKGQDRFLEKTQCYQKAQCWYIPQLLHPAREEFRCKNVVKAIGKFIQKGI
jgi:hypothetical protein